MESVSNSNLKSQTFPGEDPFVSPRALGQPRSKSIEEILQRMNGFVSELEEIDSPAIFSGPTQSRNDISSEQSQPTSLCLSSDENTKPIVVFSVPKVISKLKSLTLSPGSSTNPIVTISLPKGTVDRARIETAQLFSNHRKPDVEPDARPEASSPKVAAGDLICRTFKQNSREIEIPVDIRDFVPVNQSVDNTPEPPPGIEPLQCSFDFEMEYFERNTLLQRINPSDAPDQSWASDSTSATIPQIKNLFQPMVSPNEVQSSSQFESSGFSETVSDQPADQSEVSESVQDEQAEVIWVRENELIYVDGRDGYDYIDLTCFDISQASFEANRIRINNGIRVFEIDYRNVSHAAFANGKQVELAAFEIDFPKPVSQPNR